jgi:predicted alpha-1,2-mannosidase
MKRSIVAFTAAILWTWLPAVAQTTPVEMVDPFVGTGGTSGVGLVDDFPGATAPFGMLQWSPDTPSAPPSGGYFYRDHAITGFSLTHVSGAGCQIFGDFSVLPTIGAIRDPAHVQQPFSHSDEQASPGFYAVGIGEPAIQTEFAVTARAGVAAFTFPATTSANLIVNAASDQAGVSDAHVEIDGNNEIAGWASSGGFCGMPNVFTVYFDMQFDRPFVAHGTWNQGTVTPGTTSARGPQSGGWLTFDTTQQRTVRAKTAISYVSIDGARNNIAAEAQTWDVDALRKTTAASWNALLSEVRVDGGAAQDRRMLYTSLYHALLSPTIFSDADGSYRGFDDRIHRNPSGHDEYTNFSGWDIYRTQVPLMAMLAPRQTGDMIQSLVHAADQGGWLPKWPVANGYTGVMGGDPADGIIAEAYAFGARNFDRAGALNAMVKGATDTSSPLGQGWYHPRPGLDEYLLHGYVVNSHTTSVSPVPNGASETLEYAYDDFSIAQFARSIGRMDVYQKFRMRAQNWTALFNTSTGFVAPRDADGAFMNTPITDNGQSGFQEGNAAQYTWMVPQAFGSLIGALGGPAAAAQRLDAFFQQLDAGQDKPYAWFGNEPSLISPWAYVYVGAPYRAQYVNRQAMRTLYAPTPDGIPGNDDLGTMSAWWAWNALGVYPANPAVPVLFLGAPLFTHVTISSPSGRSVDIDAPQASGSNDYITALRVNDRAADRAWVALPERGTLRLHLDVAAQPNIAFASSPASLPPQLVPPIFRFPASTPAQIIMQNTTVSVVPGQTAALRFTVRNPGTSAVPVTWQAQLPQGIDMSPSRGDVRALPGEETSVQGSVTIRDAQQVGLYNIPILAKASNGAVLQRGTAVVRVAQAGAPIPLAYVANFSDGTVTPFDPRTHAYGTPIAVGKSPGGLAMSGDSRLYTANQGSNDVTVVDALSQKVIATVKVGNVPAGIQTTRDGKTVWLTNYADGTLQSIDAQSLQTSKPIPVGSHPEELAVSPDDSRVYVVLQGTSELAIIDTASRKLVGTVEVGRHPLGVAVNPDGKAIYVTNSASNDVTVVDAASLKTIATIPVGKTPQGLAISRDGNLLYVADSASMQVTPIDLQTNTPRPPIAAGNGPFDVTFSSDGRFAFVAASGDNDCVVIDVASGKPLGAIPTGNFPIALAQ